MKKLPKKYAAAVSGGLMSLFMCSIMSFMMTVIFTGFLTEGFWGRWANTFVYAFMVATPAVLTVAPLVKKLTARIVDMR